MTSYRVLIAVLVSLLALIGCGGDDDGSRAGTGGKPGVATDPPPPTTSDDPCIISADCPAGTYCDLGECIQGCNSETACPEGLACSARGRCLPPSEPDQDPPPVTEHAGTVSAEPTAAELTELDDTFSVALTTSAEDLVRYRVELRAPFLRLDDPERGEFIGATRLRFSVTTSGLAGTITPGMILIHTTLGDVTVNPSIRVGLTGRYQGILRYSSGQTPLGDVGFAADLLDNNGDVMVRIDPEHSMLFPEVGGTPAAGRGLFTFSEGLSVSVAQILDGEFGGSRNHFKRPIGRRVSFSLQPIGRGKLEGTFEETIYGVLEQPISLSGTAYLEPTEAQPSLDFDVPEPPSMPTVERGVFGDLALFAGWNAERGCYDDSCNVQNSAAALDCVRSTNERLYYERLEDSLSGTRPTANFLNNLATACESELSVASKTDYKSELRSCALLPPLACGLNMIPNVAWDGTLLPIARETYNRLFARILAPPLLVAQNHIVEGLKESFVSGLSTQQERFRKAREVLGTPATFLLASGALEYLRTLPVEVAQGSETSDDPTQTNYPAARALARLLYVQHTLDGEEARTAAVDVAGTQEAKIQLAQERGVLGFLEAATLAALLDTWGNPPSIGSEFIGSLTLSDRGFSALQQGAIVFGVPEGEVPMIYDPSRPQPTNFEQVLEDAQPALRRFEQDEAAFREANRTFEMSASELQHELETVRQSYEQTIQSVCGNAFDLQAVQDDADWVACGADGTGEYSELTFDIEQAHLRLQASQARLEGMKRKYQIDQKRLADTQGVREEQIRFIDETGQQLEGLVVAEGFVNVAEKALEVASNSSLWNAGAPAAMAVGVAALESMRTGINVARQRLQTAQQMRAVADENQIELINGMAELQKQLIDAAQLELEMEQDTLAIAQADLRRRNVVDQAKRAFEERRRSLARISASPLTDPTYRILQTQLALQAVNSRAEAQRRLYRVARALEYEINTPLGTALPRAVLGAYKTTEAQRLSDCLRDVFSDYRANFGVPQEFTTTISVRDMLGLADARTDEVTGEELSPGQLFRHWILRNENIDAEGNVTVTFSTNLQPGNELWSTNVCDDKIASVQAQIVGDFQGDNEAEIQVALEGGSVMRRCDSDELINWELNASRAAAIQAGVNSFGEVKPNTSLFGQSVARPSWRITIPSGVAAASNADLKIEKIEDIVLKITHRALTRQSRSIPLDVSCLGSVGAGS